MIFKTLRLKHLKHCDLKHCGAVYSKYKHTLTDFWY